MHGDAEATRIGGALVYDGGVPLLKCSILGFIRQTLSERVAFRPILRIAWASSVPSSPAPPAHRYAAAGLDCPFSPSPGPPSRDAVARGQLCHAPLGPTLFDRSNPDFHKEAVQRARSHSTGIRPDTV